MDLFVIFSQLLKGKKDPVKSIPVSDIDRSRLWLEHLEVRALQPELTCWIVTHFKLGKITKYLF